MPIQEGIEALAMTSEIFLKLTVGYVMTHSSGALDRKRDVIVAERHQALVSIPPMGTRKVRGGRNAQKLEVVESLL